MIIGGAALVVVVLLVLVLHPFGSKDSGTTTQSSQTPEPAPARTTAVPAPSGGSIKKTVAPAPPAKTYANDKASSSVDIPGEVQVKLVSVEKHKKPQAIGPGALADPVVVVTLELSNQQKDPIELHGVSVTLLYGKKHVGTPVQSELGKPFDGSLKTGESAQGSYVFSVPKKSSSTYTIFVQSEAGKGIAKFRTP